MKYIYYAGFIHFSASLRALREKMGGNLIAKYLRSFPTDFCASVSAVRDFSNNLFWAFALS